jgi:23S rRNA (cytidine1920-2'-O)/16S rRNA (cytidine1409-2'-O)-methyltransferase
VGADANRLKRVRLDALVVERGLAGSRERARALILAGQVEVDGQVVSKAGAPVGAASDVRVLQPDHPYVGRGGLKLAHALETFGIDPNGWLALDVGASTGGFTDVMLRHGARAVIALDVGHGQLDWKLRNDPRVVVLERVNARLLTAQHLPDHLRSFDLITVDVSFISLRQVLPALAPLLEPGGHLLLLVKPQFEAGRAEVGKGGIVKDPVVHARVVEEVADAASKLGLTRAGETPSPIAGAEGNREFFLHLRRPPAASNEDHSGL